MRTRKTRANARPAKKGKVAPHRRPAPERARKAPRTQAAAPREAAAERPDTSRPRAEAIARAGLGRKAEDVVILDVRGLTSYADYFVVMSADSERQAGAIADAVDEELEKAGASKVGVEGQAGGRWVLIDYGDVVAHVMSPEARGFYDLEGLWADAPRIAVHG
jgi:ribosome-associated protein